MIDSVRLKRLLLLAAVLCSVASGAALISGSPTFAGGLGLGFVLGALPFASWAWIVSHGLKGTRARILTIVLFVTKIGLYSGALYLFVTRKIVNPLGVMVGIAGVVATISIGALLAPSPAKETA